MTFCGVYSTLPSKRWLWICESGYRATSSRKWQLGSPGLFCWLSVNLMFSAILTLHVCGKHNIQAKRSCPYWGWTHRSSLDPTQNPAQSSHPPPPQCWALGYLIRPRQGDDANHHVGRVHMLLSVEAAVWPPNKVLSELFSCRHPLLRKLMPLYVLAPLWEKVLLPERLVAWWDCTYAVFGGCRVLWGCRNNSERKAVIVFKALLVGCEKHLLLSV